MNAAVAAAVIAACRADVDAFKPGNVSRAAAGHGMRAADFDASAEAIAPILAEPGLAVGARIEKSIAATVARVACNTNLGIVLLAAPLAHAVLQGRGERLRDRVEAVLAALTVEDARGAYAGIRAARAGHLGTAENHDIATVPAVNLRETMRAAAGRDRVARQYACGYCDIFEHALGWFDTARRRWPEGSWAVTALFLRVAATWPDTLVARKHGEAVAAALCRRMGEVEKAFEACKNAGSAESLLLDFDTELKRREINPGTSADLTVTTLLAQRPQLLLEA